MMKLVRSLLLSGGMTLSMVTLTFPVAALTFSGSGRGVWGVPTSSADDPAFTGVSSADFTWGVVHDDEADPNQLLFQGSPFTAIANDQFKVGNLTYFNGTILANTGIDSVPLNIELTFTSPVSVSQVFSFELDILTTPNVGTDEENADAVMPIGLISEQPFSAAGKDYTLSLVGFSEDDGVTMTEELRVLEDDRTTASLYGRIIPVPPNPSSQIPEPGAIAGLGVVVAMIGLRKGRGR